MEIKVLTYNTALHFPGYADFLRADKLRSFLVNGDWDIVGLCEVYHPSLRKILLENDDIKKKYPYRAYKLARHSKFRLDNGTVILSRHKILSKIRYQYQNFHNVWYNKLISPKDITFAEVDLDGTPIGIFVTHLQWGTIRTQVNFRKKHMVELKEFIQSTWDTQKPYMILGDFNTMGHNTGKDYQFLMKQLDGAIDWWKETNDIEKKPGFTWDPANTKVVIPFTHERLDYLFSNELIKPLETNIVKFQSSLRNIFWRPKANFSKKEHIWFFFARLIRIVTVPLLICLVIIFNIYRGLRGLPLLFFISGRDLSDHYGVEGIGIITDD